MGQEITESHFRHEEFRRFQAALRQETKLCCDWMRDGRFSDRDYCTGLELELCLVTESGEPAAFNQPLIDEVAIPEVVPELSKFNIEFNVEPASPRQSGIELLALRMAAMWDRCRQIAAPHGVSVVSIGILPTLTDADMTLEFMSDLKRYRALNEQVIRMRHGQPVRLDIQGVENLVSEHLDVMLEAATTSFQLHLQVPQARAADAYNLALVVSAPMVAISANSPLLFGKKLWQETRVPLFEQAVAMDGPLSRVTFGTGYAEGDVSSIFLENERIYPVLLPLDGCDDPTKLAHVRLHNGTIWRWNRPIIGFDDDDCPHVRIEHRVMAAGTSAVDMKAQMAFYYGLMVELLEQDSSCHRECIEAKLPFLSAWNNFYDAARSGLKSHIHWLDGKKWPMTKLILEELLPKAELGLKRLDVDASKIGEWLGIIAQRTESQRTGSHWQTEFYQRAGDDVAALVREYRDRQESGEPVHLWKL